MINVFIVHSRSDKEKVNSFVEFLKGNKDENGKKLEKQRECHCNTLVLQGTHNNWKVEAKKLIRQAQVLIFVQGEDAEKKKETIWTIDLSSKR